MKTQCTTSEELARGLRFENLRVTYFTRLGRVAQATDAHQRATFYWERLQASAATEGAIAA